jgi:hypothetical protein
MLLRPGLFIFTFEAALLLPCVSATRCAAGPVPPFVIRISDDHRTKTSKLPGLGSGRTKQGPERISVIMAPGSRLVGGSKAVGRFLGRPALALTTAFVANMAPPTYPGWGTKSSLLGSPRPGAWGILPERRRGCAAMRSSLRPMDDPLSTARARGEMGKSITLLEQRLAELGLTTALIPPVRRAKLASRNFAQICDIVSPQPRLFEDCSKAWDLGLYPERQLKAQR